MAIVSDLNDLSLGELYARLASTGLVRRLLQLAHDEDLGTDHLDATTIAILENDRQASARIILRRGGVVSGLAAIEDLIEVFGGGIGAIPTAQDGDHADPGSTLCNLHGSLHAILRLERTALNLLARLGGVASQTRRFVDLVAADGPQSPPRVLDTRKTTPGLRVLEKYAVRCGGGFCHRMGLHDAVLIKDNHLAGLSPMAAADLVRIASQRARATSPAPGFIEVEVDTLDQLDAMLTLETGTIDIVLLDNMSPAIMGEAVERRDALAPIILLEASGGINAQTIAEVARTGVDRISVGSLTHQARSLDLSLEIVP